MRLLVIVLTLVLLVSLLGFAVENLDTHVDVRVLQQLHPGVSLMVVVILSVLAGILYAGPGRERNRGPHRRAAVPARPRRPSMFRKKKAPTTPTRTAGTKPPDRTAARRSYRSITFRRSSSAR